MFIIKITEGVSEKTLRPIHYKYYDNNSNKLLIILPGVDYSTKAPILYYINQQYINYGYNVLQINYDYSDNVLSALSEEDFFEDISRVLELFIQEPIFISIEAVAKSIGTIGLAKLSEVNNFNSLIWVTPMLNNNTVQNSLILNSKKSYIFIGDNDPFYLENKLIELESNGLKIKTYKDADHSLEVKGDLDRTLNILRDLLFKLRLK